MLWVTLSLAAAAPVGAQDSSATHRLPMTVFVGTEEENYLRYLQSLGLVARYPWSARAFSPKELDRLTPRRQAHPWSAHPRLRPTVRDMGRGRAELAAADLTLIYNSAFPFGMNDGALWAGRGFTAAGQGGGGVQYGALSMVLAPMAFWTENRAFGLMPNGMTGQRAYADGLFPNAVDRPQRFGADAYGRLDPGQSTMRLDAYGVGAGFTTANQWWGPMSDYPYVLGNNAAGFPHLFIGSAVPVRIWIGRVHARVTYGQLRQSAFSPVDTGNGLRFASGAVIVFEPRWLTGLEIGATRFFHAAWPEGGPGTRYFTHLFETFLKGRITDVFLPGQKPSFNNSSDNQLASLFGRWVLNESGIEVYGEFGREDHNWHARDMFLEPDHAASTGFGIRKAWISSAAITGVRVESLRFQEPHLDRHRGEGLIYGHTETRQGHTHHGQLMASGFAVGSGAATSAIVERIGPTGMSRLSLGWLVARDNGRVAVPGPRPVETHFMLGVERSFIRNLIEFSSGLKAVYQMNRYFGSDAFGLNVELGATRF